jgi:hypothetical protein
MNDDPIVASVRRVREQLAARFNYDVHAIFTDMRARESQAGDRLVRQPARPNKAMHPSGGDIVSDSGQSTPAAG